MNNNYRISLNTFAILPLYDMEYRSTILEQEGSFARKEKPLDILKENCLHYGSSYQGRKASVQHHLNFQQKTPIPIHPAKGICAIPTQSSQSFDCVWLFFHAIMRIEEELTKDQRQHTRVHFINGKSLTLPISTYTIQKQIDRAGMCKVVFDSMNGDVSEI